jgi:hypothetical protein
MRLGVTEACLLAFEEGSTRIDAATMLKICDTLGLSPNYFFEPWTQKRLSAQDAAE